MKSLVAKLFVVAGFVLFASSACAAIDQNTLLGQMEMAMRDRGETQTGEFTIDQHIQNYKSSGGGPRLKSMGVAMGAIASNDTSAKVMSVLMALLVAAAITRALRDSNRTTALPDLCVSLGFKFMLGIAVFHMPWLVYRVGMTLRDLGTTVARVAFTQPVTGEKLSQLSKASSSGAMSFDQVKATAIDRALQDCGQPMRGHGSVISSIVYNRMQKEADSLANAKDHSHIAIHRMTFSGSSLDKERIFDESASKLFQFLANADTTSAFTFTSYRVGPRGLPDIHTHKTSSPLNLQNVEDTSALSQSIDASEIAITVPSLPECFKTPEPLKKHFNTKTDPGEFKSNSEQESDYRNAIGSYNDQIYQATSAFIKATYWANLAFACGKYGGADWDYLSKKSENDQQAVRQAQKDLAQWYENSTSRPNASFTVAPPVEQTSKNVSGKVLEVLQFVRDKLVTKSGIIFFDVVVEVYTV